MFVQIFDIMLPNLVLLFLKITFTLISEIIALISWLLAFNIFEGLSVHAQPDRLCNNVFFITNINRETEILPLLILNGLFELPWITFH